MRGRATRSRRQGSFAPSMSSRPYQGTAGAPKMRRGAEGVAMMLALRQTIADVLGVPVGSAATGIALTTELDADLLLDVTLVVEDAYEVRFSEPELRRFSCLNDIADCLSERARCLHGSPAGRVSAA